MAVKETPYSQKIIKALRAKGLTRTFKVSTPTATGVPDIYVNGGNWIESKIGLVNNKRKTNIYGLFDKIQRYWLKEAQDLGDNCFGAIRINIYNFMVGKIDESYSLMCPFNYFVDNPWWTAEEVRRYGQKITSGGFDTPIFDANLERNIDRIYIAETFGKGYYNG